MLGFPLDSWDYATFAVLFVLGAAALTAAVLLPGLASLDRHMKSVSFTALSSDHARSSPCHLGRVDGWSGRRRATDQAPKS